MGFLVPGSPLAILLVDVSTTLQRCLDPFKLVLRHNGIEQGVRWVDELVFGFLQDKRILLFAFVLGWLLVQTDTIRTNAQFAPCRKADVGGIGKNDFHAMIAERFVIMTVALLPEVFGDVGERHSLVVQLEHEAHGLQSVFHDGRFITVSGGLLVSGWHIVDDFFLLGSDVAFCDYAVIVSDHSAIGRIPEDFEEMRAKAEPHHSEEGTGDVIEGIAHKVKAERTIAGSRPTVFRHLNHFEDVLFCLHRHHSGCCARKRNDSVIIAVVATRQIQTVHHRPELSIGLHQLTAELHELINVGHAPTVEGGNDNPIDFPRTAECEKSLKVLTLGRFMAFFLVFKHHLREKGQVFGFAESQDMFPLLFKFLLRGADPSIICDAVG
jgi:hypothetical protein